MTKNKPGNAPPPVVLIGVSSADGALGAVGLYADYASAHKAVIDGDVPPNQFYSVMTPPLGVTLEKRSIVNRKPLYE